MKSIGVLKVFYGCVIYLFLYLPILVLAIFSFNESKTTAIWTGFSMDWYGKLFENRAVLDALGNSLLVAFLCTLFSLLLGVLGAVGMHRFTFRFRSMLDALIYVPVIIPEVVMGISLLAFFAIVRQVMDATLGLSFSLGIPTIVISHITFSVPFVMLVIRSRLQGADPRLEEAAMDLGADALQTFLRVTIPTLLPGIAAGALLAFTLSLDDVIISFFVGGNEKTLPMQVYGMVRFGVSPEVNALSTLLVILTICIVVAYERLQDKGRMKRKRAIP